MNKKIIIGGIILAVFGIFVDFSLSRGDFYNWNYKYDRSFPDGYMMFNNSVAKRSIDQHFIIQMIPHHEGAIAMAKIALERSKRPEIISLAKNIIEAQERENKNMREWYEEWFGSAPPENIIGMMHMAGMEGDTNALINISADDFDREFLSQMIPHHEIAIMMAQMLLFGTNREELKNLADQISISQAEEIETMKGWLKNWYGVRINRI